jgi:hypothetical protein
MEWYPNKTISSWDLGEATNQESGVAIARWDLDEAVGLDLDEATRREPNLVVTQQELLRLYMSSSSLSSLFLY